MPRKAKENHEGKRYGCLLIGPVAFRVGKHDYYHTICDCGKRDSKHLDRKIKDGRAYCSVLCPLNPRNKIEGQELTRQQIMDQIGLNSDALRKRRRDGVPLLKPKEIHDGSVNALAAEVGVSRKTMSRRIKKYGRNSPMLRWSASQIMSFENFNAKRKKSHETQSG